MSALNKAAMQLYIKLVQAKQDFLEEERGAVDIVAIVILIAVAVGLALLFREQITKVLDNLFGQIEQGTEGIASKPAI